MRKEYVTVRANEPEIRGKILTSSLAKKVHQLPRIPQLQRRRTYNTPFNVVLALALDRLPLLLSERPDALRRVALLREHWAAIDRHSRDAMAAVIAAQDVCPPGYRDALQLARLILVGAALDSQATAGGQAFTLSLASIWERALGRMFDDLSGKSGWRRVNKELRTRRWDDPAGRNDPKRWMTADVILERQGARWVLDAKYKREFGDESRMDRFQICAYAVAFDGEHASLVYPTNSNGALVRELLTATFHGRKVQIDSFGLPIHAGPEVCRTALSAVIGGV